jgi:AcrR family transcriptional regulator
MGRDTRERIVEAAIRVLGRSGYAATSIKDIADEARIAPGLVHYYFKTKHDLVVAAVRRCCDDALPTLDGDPTRAALAAFEGVKQPNERAAFFWPLFVELLGLARRDDAIRATLLEFVRDDRHFIEEAGYAVAAQREDRSPDEVPAIAAVVWGAIFGIELQRLIDPTFDAAAAVDALAAMVLK